MRVCVLPKKMTQAEKKQRAAQMAAYIAPLLNGDRQDPRTWARLLSGIGVGIVGVKSTPPFVANFTASDFHQEFPLGEVHYSTLQPKRTQARGLAHETAHALQQAWVPQMLYGVDLVYSYHDDCRDVRHQIATMFERMMMG